MRLALNHRDVLAQYPALLSELDQLIARINLVFETQHDPQTGAHTDVSVTGLTWEGDTQLTVGAAGGASALPATPTGYLTITIDATNYVVPFYEAS